MSFTATGPILLLLAMYIFAFRPFQLAYYAVFFAPFSATAVVNFNSVGYKAGGVGVSPGMTFTLFFFVAQLIYRFCTQKTKVSSGHLIQIGLMAMFLIVVYLSLLWNTGMGHVIDPVKTHSIYITIYMMAAMFFSLDFAREGNIDKVVSITRASMIFVCLWGLLQLGCSLTGIPYPSILFNNSNSDSADMFAQSIGSFSRIASVAVEPSVMAAALLDFAAFGITILSRDERLRNRYWYSAVGLVVVTLLLSTSSTGYIGLLVIGGLLLLQRPMYALVIGVPFLTVFLGILTAFPKAFDILLSSTVNKTASTSYTDRSSQVVIDFANFLHQPLLGWGWGRAINFNAAATLLCNVGVIGTAVFVAAMGMTLGSLTLGARNAQESDWKLAVYAVGVRNALIVAAVVGVTSGMKYVFLTDWIFWALGIALASRLEVGQKVAVFTASRAPSPVRESVA